MESYFHPPFATSRPPSLDERITNGFNNENCGQSGPVLPAPSAPSALLPWPSSSSSIATALEMARRIVSQSHPASASASASGSLQSINDACRWSSSNADESYDGGGGHGNGNGNSNSNCEPIASADDGSSGNSRICDVVDSSVRYGIEGDIHWNYNLNTNSIDSECGSGAMAAETMASTVINYLLRDITSGLTTSMKTVIRPYKCASRTPWWKSIISVVIYLLLVTSATRTCAAHKHEGTSLITLHHFINLICI